MGAITKGHAPHDGINIWCNALRLLHPTKSDFKVLIFGFLSLCAASISRKQAGLIEGTPQGRQTGVAFFLVTFSLAKQEKVTSCRATPGDVDFVCFCFDRLSTNGHLWLLNLPPLNTDPHHLAVAYRLQFGDADFDPGCIEVLEDDLRDVFCQGFHQGEMPLAQYSLEVLRDFCIIQRVFDVIAGAGAAVGQRDVEVDLQGLWHDLFTFIDANESGDFEFA